MSVPQVAKSVAAMLSAPVRLRRNPPSAPLDLVHYEIPPLAASAQAATSPAADAPVVRTPPGRWKQWPPLVLAECDEPLVDGAPDLRGVWRAYKGPMTGHVERIEQSGDRVVITAGGVIHDMFANGTLAGGVNDEGVGGAPIAVAARFEAARLNLYLNNKRLVVTRYLDGDDIIWRWGPYTSRLRRLTAPPT